MTDRGGDLGPSAAARRVQARLAGGTVVDEAIGALMVWESHDRNEACRLLTAPSGGAVAGREREARSVAYAVDAAAVPAIDPDGDWDG